MNFFSSFFSLWKREQINIPLSCNLCCKAEKTLVIKIFPKWNEVKSSIHLASFTSQPHDFGGLSNCGVDSNNCPLRRVPRVPTLLCGAVRELPRDFPQATPRDSFSTLPLGFSTVVFTLPLLQLPGQPPDYCWIYSVIVIPGVAMVVKQTPALLLQIRCSRGCFSSTSIAAVLQYCRGQWERG